MAPTPEPPHQLERTARRIVAGTWVCAGIVMAAGAVNAVITFQAIDDSWVLGLATGLAVDVSLCVALIGDRRLSAHGVTSPWGRCLRIVAAVMALVLYTGWALLGGHYFMALLHAFLPVLLIALTEYGQDVLLKLAALANDQSAPTPAVEPEPSPTPVMPPAAPLPVPPVTYPVVTPKQPEPVREDDAAPAPVPRRSGTPRTEVTPELLAQVRAWRSKRMQDGLPVGRRPVSEELGLSDGLARKVLHALAGEPHLRATGT
jgi:hypothetical protein